MKDLQGSGMILDKNSPKQKKLHKKLQRLHHQPHQPHHQPHQPHHQPISHTHGCGTRGANYTRTFTRSHPQETEIQLKQTTNAKVTMFKKFFLAQANNKTKVATFNCFLNFFSALYKFWNVLIVYFFSALYKFRNVLICIYLISCNILQFLFCFMLAKAVKRKQ